MRVNSRDEQAFINRLTSIVEANLGNEHFGVSGLAREMGMSRSMLFIKIKTITRKSASFFISEVRLKKAGEMLKTTSLTVSEIAYEVGFSSPAYFNHCFHKYFGYPPGEAKKQSLEVSDSENKKEIKARGPFLKKRLWTITSILTVIIALLATFYLFTFRSTKELANIPTDKSIAILPLKNAGSDRETQILADGIIEDILNRLSKIEGLTVKSRNSSEVYRNATKPTPQIAAELGVSYLLEGTLLKDGEKVRIYVQLIDAINDTHVWSDQYEQDLQGIFTFITDVSRQIAEELKFELSEVEMEGIEKVYTQNTEAYQLYLKGRYFWFRRTVDDLKISIDYFNQALAIDPEYSLAYAGLADAYLIMAYWEWLPGEEAWRKSKEYAMKALQIDNKLAEAHAVLGNIATCYEMNWKTAERELKLAVELDPNNAIVRQYYGEYLSIRGNFKEAIAELNLALKLNPNAPAIYSVRAFCHYDSGKFNEALQDMKKLSELNRYYLLKNYLIFKIYIRQGDDLKAIDELKKIISIYDPEMDPEKKLSDIYSVSGMEGIIHWTIEWLLSKKSTDNSTGLFNDDKLIAELYSLTGETDSVLVFLERFSESKTIGRLFLRNGFDFKYLHSDPRFKAILSKMNIPDE